jgi:hypothetical protein
MERLPSCKKPSHYYKPIENKPDVEKENILNFIKGLFAKRPFLGHRKIYEYLIEAGYSIGRDRV